jgi:hypothetical protein
VKRVRGGDYHAPSNFAVTDKVFADVNSEADRSDINLFQFSLRHRPDGACDNRLHAIPAGSSASAEVKIYTVQD